MAHWSKFLLKESFGSASSAALSYGRKLYAQVESAARSRILRSRHTVSNLGPSRPRARYLSRSFQLQVQSPILIGLQIASLQITR